MGHLAVVVLAEGEQDPVLELEGQRPHGRSRTVAEEQVPLLGGGELEGPSLPARGGIGVVVHAVGPGAGEATEVHGVIDPRAPPELALLVGQERLHQRRENGVDWDERVREMKEQHGYDMTWPPNLDVVGGLLRCFDEPYRKAYGEECR